MRINLDSFYHNTHIHYQLIFNEYFRLWKLIGLFLVISSLIIGSLLFELPDWDISISIIMPVFTYFLSPISLWLFLNLKDKRFLGKSLCIMISLFLCWFSIDFIYCYYNDYYHHHYYRESNFFASFILYWLSAFFLAYCGTFKELKRDIQTIQFIK